MHGRHLARSGEQIVEEELAKSIMAGQFDDPRLSPRERAAVRYADQMWHDHHGVNDALWSELKDVFTHEEIVELGMSVANYIGMGQFIAMLGLPNLAHQE
jgi:alkylhydroperoxidase family enzyme